MAYAHPIESEEEVRALLNSYKKDYPDARHHCLAFVQGVNGDVFRAQDDGEPSNSAGTPILGQIRSFGLTNIAIVVVRYFGGTKLGVPGLVNAYKSSAKEALLNAEVVESEEKCSSVIVCNISEVDKLKSRLLKSGAILHKVEYGEQCTVSLSYPLSNREVPVLLQGFPAE